MDLFQKIVTTHIRIIIAILALGLLLVIVALSSSLLYTLFDRNDNPPIDNQVKPDQLQFPHLPCIPNQEDVGERVSNRVEARFVVVDALSQRPILDIDCRAFPDHNSKLLKHHTFSREGYIGVQYSSKLVEKISFVSKGYKEYIFTIPSSLKSQYNILLFPKPNTIQISIKPSSSSNFNYSKDFKLSVTFSDHDSVAEKLKRLDMSKYPSVKSLLSKHSSSISLTPNKNGMANIDVHFPGKYIFEVDSFFGKPTAYERRLTMDSSSLNLAYDVKYGCIVGMICDVELNRFNAFDGEIYLVSERTKIACEQLLRSDFIFSAIQPGTYSLCILPLFSDAIYFEKNIHVTLGERLEEKVILSDSDRLCGIVVDTNMRPLQGVTITVSGKFRDSIGSSSELENAIGHAGKRGVYNWQLFSGRELDYRISTMSDKDGKFSFPGSVRTLKVIEAERNSEILYSGQLSNRNEYTIIIDKDKKGTSVDFVINSRSAFSKIEIRQYKGYKRKIIWFSKNKLNRYSTNVSCDDEYFEIMKYDRTMKIIAVCSLMVQRKIQREYNLIFTKPGKIKLSVICNDKERIVCFATRLIDDFRIEAIATKDNKLLEFGNIPAGKYKIKIKAKGYKEKEIDVFISEGDEIELGSIILQK